MIELKCLSTNKKIKQTPHNYDLSFKCSFFFSFSEKRIKNRIWEEISLQLAAPSLHHNYIFVLNLPRK